MRSKLSESELEARHKLGEWYNAASGLRHLKYRVAGLELHSIYSFLKRRRLPKRIEQLQARFRSTEVTGLAVERDYFPGFG